MKKGYFRWLCLLLIFVLYAGYKWFRHQYYLYDPSVTAESYQEVAERCVPQGMILPDKSLLMEENRYYMAIGGRWCWESPMAYGIESKVRDAERMAYSFGCSRDLAGYEDTESVYWDTIYYQSIPISCLETIGQTEQGEPIVYYTAVFTIDNYRYSVNVSQIYPEEESAKEYTHEAIRTIIDKMDD